MNKHNITHDSNTGGIYVNDVYDADLSEHFQKYRTIDNIDIKAYLTQNYANANPTAKPAAGMNMGGIAALMGGGNTNTNKNSGGNIKPITIAPTVEARGPIKITESANVPVMTVDDYNGIKSVQKLTPMAINFEESDTPLTLNSDKYAVLSDYRDHRFKNGNKETPTLITTTLVSEVFITGDFDVKNEVFTEILNYHLAGDIKGAEYKRDWDKLIDVASTKPALKSTLLDVEDSIGLVEFSDVSEVKDVTMITRPLSIIITNGHRLEIELESNEITNSLTVDPKGSSSLCEWLEYSTPITYIITNAGIYIVCNWVITRIDNQLWR